MAELGFVEKLKREAKCCDHLPIGEEELEIWLRFIDNAKQLPRFWSRIISKREQRDEAFAEICSAFFLGQLCGFAIAEWEPVGRNGNRGEFLVQVGTSRVFCEVKSPGWEDEVVREEGTKSPTLEGPKPIPTRIYCPNNDKAISKAVEKAYPKFVECMPNLLILMDDRRVSLQAFPIAPGTGIYKVLYSSSPIGCFAANDYGLLGGILLLRVSPISERLFPGEFEHDPRFRIGTKKTEVYEYRFSLLPNSNAARPLPQGVFGSLGS